MTTWTEREVSVRTAAGRVTTTGWAPEGEEHLVVTTHAGAWHCTHVATGTFLTGRDHETQARDDLEALQDLDWTLTPAQLRLSAAHRNAVQARQEPA